MIVNAQQLTEGELKYCYEMYCKALDMYIYKTRRGQYHRQACMRISIDIAYTLDMGERLPYFHLQKIKENQYLSEEELMNTLIYITENYVRKDSQFKPYHKPTRLPIFKGKSVYIITYNAKNNQFKQLKRLSIYDYFGFVLKTNNFYDYYGFALKN